MRKPFLLLIIVLSLVNFELKSQWTQLNTSGFDLFDCSFPSESTGYVCGYGNNFFKTTNGGTTWLNLSLQGTANDLNAVFFTDNQTGYLCSTKQAIIL